MKNYFKFNLTGKKILPVWIALIVLFIIPYIYVQVKIKGLSGQTADPQETMVRLVEVLKWYGVMIPLYLVEYSILFFFAKLAIQTIEFKEQAFQFAGKFKDFLLVLVPGFFLSIMTIGIYSPWFATRINKFFAKNTSHNSNSLDFKGKGSDLFLIILFGIIIPMIVLSSILGIYTFIELKSGAISATTPNIVGIVTLIMILLMVIIFIPYMYYAYKWMVNYKFKEYSIQWETSFWSSAVKIFVEVFLSVITIGIYLPLASLKLFKYFSDRTIATSESGSKKFGYDIEPANDFLFIWKQFLLTIITLGIYYPWALCKISYRVIGKTYVEEITVE